jgi:subtilisin-like proprotein convertase family protein
MYLTSKKCDCPTGRYYYPSGTCNYFSNTGGTNRANFTWDDPFSYSSVISIGAIGSLVSMSVSVNINHSYIGDLRIVLTSPSLTSVILHQNTGGAGINLVGTYPGSLTPFQNLSLFYATEIQGSWRLTIHDDVDRGLNGTLNWWSISINYIGAIRISSPNIAWSDPHTFTDIISMDRSGSLMSIKVTMNITHNYIGDLRVVLTSPSLVSVDLHRYTGGAGANIVGTYPDTLTPYDSLSLIYGTQITGNWVLTVYNDFDRGSVGTLNSWSVIIYYISY